MVRGEEQESSTDCIWEDTMAPFESCRSTDTNLLLATVTKWEDMGCTPCTTPEYSSLLRTHKTQKPSISQGLYPILLLALSTLTTSAYTSLGVAQDSNPRPQLLKASVYYSATSAGVLVRKGRAKGSKVGCFCCRHVMPGTETRNPYCCGRRARGFGCRDAVLDVFMILPS
jgi:hypothetical protein